MKFGTMITGVICASVCALTTATAEEIVVSDDKLHIEGVDVAADGRIFVGSLVDSSVWMVSADGESVSQFTEPGSLGMDSAVGVKVDERANELFVCSGPVLGVSHFAESAKEAGVLVYDLTSGAPLRRYDFPGGGFCNDIAFGPDGALYATDSFNPRILTLAPGASELTTFIKNEELGGEGWVLNGLAVHFDTLYTVKETDGRMFAIDILKSGKAAVLSGINMRRVQTMTFVIAGVMTAIGAVLMSARLNSGSPNYGQTLELQAIAAAVVGGASLMGGRGNVLATLLGAMTIVVVQNGLNLNATPSSIQNIILGIIILMAVGIDNWRAEIASIFARRTPIERR